MDYFLFLLTTTVLLLRPQDFVPELAAAPIYLAVLLLAALVASPALLDQLSGAALAARPITVCVGGVWVAVMLSHLSHGSVWGARTAGSDFGKIVLFYLVLLATVTTPARLHRLLACLAVCILVVTVLGLLQYHELVSIPQLAALQQREIDDDTGEITIIPRLVSIGQFNDPNDLCLLLLIGMGSAAFRLTAPGAGLARPFWLTFLGTMLYALALTYSRGGLLALLAGMFVLFQSRYGWWKAGALAGLAVPVLLLALGGRQTEFTTCESTSQDRIQLWSEALMLLAQAPLFGIGRGEFQEEVGLVAHNSYLHCYAELGLLGGTCFLGAFFTALWSLVRLGTWPARRTDPELLRFRPYLLAIMAAYGAGILPLSRAYIPPTYLVLGLTACYVSLAGPPPSLALPRCDFRFLQRLTGVSVAFLLGIYVFVRLTINRG